MFSEKTDDVEMSDETLFYFIFLFKTALGAPYRHQNYFKTLDKIQTVLLIATSLLTEKVKAKIKDFRNMFVQQK